MTASKAITRVTPIKVGLVLSVGIVLIVTVAGFGRACNSTADCDLRYRLLWEAPANELGDTLLGIGSALAFIWLVVTAWMQSMELRAQRDELRAQRDESAKMSRALEAQAAIFQDEQNERKQVQADRAISAFMAAFLTEANSVIGGMSVRVADQVGDGNWITLRGFKGELEMMFRSHVHQLSASKLLISEDVEFAVRPSSPRIRGLADNLTAILGRREDASDAMKIYLGTLPLLQAISCLEQLWMTVLRSESEGCGS